MITGELGESGFEHTERHCAEAISVVFWLGNTAATRKTADRAELQVFQPGVGRRRVCEFKMPSETHLLDHTIVAFELVFKAGKCERSREFMVLLNDRVGAGRYGL